MAKNISYSDAVKMDKEELITLIIGKLDVVGYLDYEDICNKIVVAENGFGAYKFISSMDSNGVTITEMEGLDLAVADATADYSDLSMKVLARINKGIDFYITSVTY